MKLPGPYSSIIRSITLALAIVLVAPTQALAASSTVREPAFSLPHIYGDTDVEMARENGREIAKDRLVQIILLARVGRGTLHQALGALDPGLLNDDISTRSTGYTSSELNNMYAKFPQRERDLIFAYCQGVNDTIDDIYAGTLPEPIEINILRSPFAGIEIGDDLFGNKTNISDQVDPLYAPPGGEWPNAGFQFTPEVAMSIAVLEIRNFGFESFNEASRLNELQALIAKHGASAGEEIWKDLNFLNDPLAPVSVPDPNTPGFGGPADPSRPRPRPPQRCSPLQRRRRSRSPAASPPSPSAILATTTPARRRGGGRPQSGGPRMPLASAPGRRSAATPG
jgi:penicillin amidase